MGREQSLELVLAAEVAELEAPMGQPLQIPGNSSAQASVGFRPNRVVSCLQPQPEAGLTVSLL